MEERSNKRWTLIAVCATTFMLLVDITVVNVALPSIQEQLNAGLTGLQWVVDAYAITLAALILTMGALADRYGRRRVFMIGVTVFSGASLLCGLAWSIAALDIARALQGVGGAVLFATSLAIIGATYQGRERAGAIAIWGATVGAAVASGPLVGGVLTEAFGWRWVFFVNVPVGAFALFAAVTRMGESRDERAVRTDIWGVITLSGALFLVVFGLLRGNPSGWSSSLIVGSLVGGVVLLAVFVAVELMQERPMLDMELFRSPGFVGVSIATFCLGGGMFALFPFLSIYLQDVLGYGPLGAGLRFLPLTVFVFLVPLVTRNVVQRVSVQLVLVVSFVLIAVSLVLMHGLSADSRWTALLPGLIVSGLGIGLANPTIAAAALRVVDPTRTGMASGANNMFRLTGLSVGVAALGAILESRASSSLVASLGPRGHGLASAVAATGARAGAGRPLVEHAATVAFVNGLNGVLLISCGVIVAGAVAVGALVRLDPVATAGEAAGAGERPRASESA